MTLHSAHPRKRPEKAASPSARQTRMISWAGYLMVFYGAAHTLGALTIEEAARHSGSWFSGGLWREDFADPSAAGSAYWFSLGSFGVPITVIGLLVLWLNRRGIAPPRFVGAIIGVWSVIDAAILLVTPWPLMLIACGLLLFANRSHLSKP